MASSALEASQPSSETAATSGLSDSLPASRKSYANVVLRVNAETKDSPVPAANTKDMVKAGSKGSRNSKLPELDNAEKELVHNKIGDSSRKVAQANDQTPTSDAADDLEGFETVVSKREKHKFKNGRHPVRSFRVPEKRILPDTRSIDKCIPPSSSQPVTNGSICSESSSSSSVDCHIASVTSDENGLTSLSNGTESAGETDVGSVDDNKPKFVVAPAPKVNPWQANPNAASVIAKKAGPSNVVEKTAAPSIIDTAENTKARSLREPVNNRPKVRRHQVANRPSEKANVEDWPALGDTSAQMDSDTLPESKSNPSCLLVSSATESTDSGEESPTKSPLNPDKWPLVSDTSVESNNIKAMDSSEADHPDQVIARLEIRDGTEDNTVKGSNSAEEGIDAESGSCDDTGLAKKTKKGARPKWVPLTLPETSKARSSRRDKPTERSNGKTAEQVSAPSQRIAPRGRRGGPMGGRGRGGLRNNGRSGYHKDRNDIRMFNTDEYKDYPSEYSTLNPIYNMSEFIMPYVTHPHGPTTFNTPLPGAPLTPVEAVFLPEDSSIVIEMVKKQIEYYFSEENLEKDFYLRRKMDADGFLPVRLISSFHRVKNMTQDYGLVLTAIRSSNELELKEDMSCVRTAVNPTKWPILDTVVPPPPVPAYPTMMMPLSSGIGIPLPASKIEALPENGDMLNPNVPDFIPKSNPSY